MRSLRVCFARLGELVFKPRRDEDLSAEMESHLQMHSDDGVRAGLSPEEARRRALIALGGVEQAQESYRDLRGFPALETVIRDLSLGLRMLRKNPGFTGVAVLTLALGIGANTAIFSAVNAVLLEPLPYKDPSKLVFLWSTMVSMGVPTSGSSAPDFREWRDRNTVFTGVAAFNYKDFDLSIPGEEPSRLQGATVTPNLFLLLGINPAIGRDFLPEEEQWGRHQLVLLSYGLWQTQFGGDTKVLGRAIHLDGQDYTIVGVMPQGMPFFNDLPPVDLWVPLAYAPGDLMNTRDNHYLEIVARLKPGTATEQAQAETSGIAKQLEKEFPENKGVGAKIVIAREQMVGNVRPSMLILLAAVAFVLLIACVNVANLMLARATAREQEFAVRSALGASRQRLLAQSFLESIPIACLGGIGGVWLAAWGIKAIESLIPSDLPRFNPIGINAGVLIFTAAISLLTTALVAIVPAGHAAKADVQENLREGSHSGHDSRSGRRLRSFLVVSELALALLLLVGAGLLVKTFGALRQVDPGFSADHVLTGRLPLSPTQFPPGHENQAIEFLQQFIARVASLPGVKGVGLTSFLPLGPGGNWGKFVQIEGQTPATSLDKVPIVRIQLSTAGYMPAIRARLWQGRFFTEQDNQQAPGVAIINETFAHQFFPNENPIGKSIRMLPPINLLTPEVRERASQAPWRKVIGVIADIKDREINQAVQPTVYAPLLQGTSEGYLASLVSMRFTVRTADDPLSLAGAIRDQVHSLLPDQPVAAIATMDQLVSRSLSTARFSMLLLSVFATIALVLAAVGIYGVMAYAAAQRTHEIGVRIALGAGRGDVLRLMLKQGAKLALVGIAIGLVAAVGLTRLMRGVLYGVSAMDPTTFLGMAILLAGVALLACYIPARRTLRVDPAVALRHE